MPYFTKCCCYFKLETGAMIMGTISIFNDILGITAGSMQMVELNSSSDDTLIDEKLIAIHWLTRVWMIWSLTMASLMLVCAFLMFYGILFRHRYFLIPYLTCEVIQTCFSFLHLVYLILVAINPDEYVLFDKELEDDQGELVGVIIYLSFSLVLQLYLWFCIYSLFQVYRFGKKPPAVEELARDQAGPPMPLVFTTPIKVSLPKEDL